MLSEDESGRADVATSYASAPTVLAPRLGGGASALMATAAEVEALAAAQQPTVRSLDAWRNRDRTRTVAVGLVMCLNIGTDPPDAERVPPCARDECWIDPGALPAQRALDAIGAALHAQYDRWQPKAKYKLSLDPTADDVRKLAASLRKHAKEERVLLHFNGHGVPRPTPGGELWVFNKAYTQYVPLAIADVLTWAGAPALFVLDCASAGALLPHFADAATAGGAGRGGGGGGGGSGSGSAAAGGGSSKGVGQMPPSASAAAAAAATTTASSSAGDSARGGATAAPPRDYTVLAACSAGESLPTAPELPADVFTGAACGGVQRLTWQCSVASLACQG